ncbi:MAG TPA: response regulator [Chloroflexia bacterium]
MNNGKFILIVEDDPALRTSLTRDLEAQGYMVLQAGTYREALDMLTVRPALAIVDVTGPACAGWDVARWLEQTTDSVPLMLISDTLPDARRLQRYHPVACMPRFCATTDLPAAVRSRLARPTTHYGV